MKIQAWIAPFCAGWIALAAHAGDNTTIPQLGCTTPVTVFNTGTDAAGAALDLGAQESTWFYNFRHQLVGGPPVSLEPQANADGAWRTTVRYEDPAWTAGGSAFADAKWVSPVAEDAPSTVGVNHTRIRGNVNYDYAYSNPYYNMYRFQFTLAPEVDSNHFEFDMRYYTDDSMQGVYVNSTTAMSPLPAGGFHSNPTTDASQNVKLTGPWQAGLNTIIFSVKDTGWSAGFLARMVPTVRSFCNAVPIRIAKTADKTAYLPGESITYTVTAENMGVDTVTANSLADPTPAGVQNAQWNCSSSLATGASCPTAPITAPINFDIKAGEKLTFTLTGTTAQTGSLSNTATLTPGTGGVCAADTGCTQTVSPTLTPVPNLTPAWAPGTPSALTVGTPATFTVNANNLGEAASTDGTLTITLPADMAFTGTPPAGCVVGGSSMSCTLPAIGANTRTTAITFSAQANAEIVNAAITANISDVTNESLLSDNAATTPVSAKKPDGGGPIHNGGTAQPVPVFAPWALAAMGMLMALSGWFVRRRQ